MLSAELIKELKISVLLISTFPLSSQRCHWTNGSGKASPGGCVPCAHGVLVGSQGPEGVVPVVIGASLRAWGSPPHC